MGKYTEEEFKYILKQAYERILNRKEGTFVNPIRVSIIESERGWGQSLINIKVFGTKEDALKFIKEFNSDLNNETVPDSYIYAKLENN